VPLRQIEHLLPYSLISRFSFWFSFVGSLCLFVLFVRYLWSFSFVATHRSLLAKLPAQDAGIDRGPTSLTIPRRPNGGLTLLRLEEVSAYGAHITQTHRVPAGKSQTERSGTSKPDFTVSSLLPFHM
jgi:hypothetical protein